jgi:aspartate--ammonia ligase
MKYLELLKTEEAISFVKETFSKQLSEKLTLIRVSSPLAVLDGTGINDDLNSIERPVTFAIKSMSERKAVVVHSLAKWKRIRLKELGIECGRGILTDMRALRPDEDYSPLHSIYVDQWDWEKHILPQQRSIQYLKHTVAEIFAALKETEKQVCTQYPEILPILPPEIKFIHAEELLQKYPTLSVKERESKIAKEHGAVFIIGIGGKLSNGQPHDMRAPDYDDWSSANDEGYYGLNGDIILWNPILKCAFEISSMGIRVDRKALMKQLELLDCTERMGLSYHNMLLKRGLPLSIGGGIGQSRVCMFMLRKSHIGEVQVSIWPDEERQSLELLGVNLL